MTAITHAHPHDHSRAAHHARTHHSPGRHPTAAHSPRPPAPHAHPPTVLPTGGPPPLGDAPPTPQSAVAAEDAPAPNWGHWLGRYGEEAAARYLTACGYRVLDRNWVCRDADLRGELDLIARHRRTIVVCEVKTRTGTYLAHPAEAVTGEKAARLRLLATRWVVHHLGAAAAKPLQTDPRPGRSPGLRVDVIAVRTGPRPPYPLRSLDHLVGVA